MAKAKRAVPEGLHTVTPALTLDDATKAIDWYKEKRLGAEEKSRAGGPTERSFNAQIRHRRIEHHAPRRDDGREVGANALGASPDRALGLRRRRDASSPARTSAGANAAKAPMGQMADQFWGDRCGTITDPEGYQWTIATHKEDLTPEEMKQRQVEFMKNFKA